LTKLPNQHKYQLGTAIKPPTLAEHGESITAKAKQVHHTTFTGAHHIVKRASMIPK
jgi:hypothetical protein